MAKKKTAGKTTPPKQETKKRRTKKSKIPIRRGGKAKGVKLKPKGERTPPEFRLDIKGDVEIFWSVLNETWVLWVETKSGRNLTKKMSSHEMAVRIGREVVEKGSVNPDHWKSDIYRYPDDVMSYTMIRKSLVAAGNAPGLTHGCDNDQQDLPDHKKIWHVWTHGLGTEPRPLWSVVAKDFTRAELNNLRRLASAYRSGYDYAISVVSGKDKTKRK